MKIIAGNWKMNGCLDTLENMVNGLKSIQTENTVILNVPFTLLGRASSDVANFGAQDISQHDKGAYTGEISGEMIAATGAKYAIVGHSERRQYHNETNNIVAAKAAAALRHGITPIICVGETIEEKQAGKTMEIIESGVRESVPNADGTVIVAYEPRWAIGAGLTPTTEEIAEAHGLIAKVLNDMGRGGTAILYGASVNGGNAQEIMSIPNVDGVLVGGASLKPDDFIPIIMAV